MLEERDRMTEGMMQERRRFVRVSSDLPVQLKSFPQTYPLKMHNSLCQDISEGGVKLASFYFHPIRSKVIVEIFLSETVEPVKAIGRVVWIEQFPYQDRYRLGLEFADINEDGKVHLKEIISNTLTTT